MKYIFIFIILSLNLTQIAAAYMTVAESGELVPENQFRISIEPQINYFDFAGHFDTGVAEDAQVRLSAGVGNAGHHIDFFYKRIPFPDYDNQPAIGYKIGVSFAKESKSNVVTPLFYPLISKNFIINKDRWTPYLSLPIGVSVFQSRSETPVRFVTGVEYVPTSVENMQFGAEIGFNIKDSFSYASAFVSFYFEPTEQVIDNN
jgi:hypothetical protein